MSPFKALDSFRYGTALLGNASRLLVSIVVRPDRQAGGGENEAANLNHLAAFGMLVARQVPTETIHGKHD